jgi:hypothetical protein
LYAVAANAGAADVANHLKLNQIKLTIVISVHAGVDSTAAVFAVYASGLCGELDP